MNPIPFLGRVLLFAVIVVFAAENRLVQIIAGIFGILALMLIGGTYFQIGPGAFKKLRKRNTKEH